MPPIRKLENQTFGFLTVEGRSEDAQWGRRYVRWQCRCICGREVVVDGKHLLSGATLSCGCQGLGGEKIKPQQHPAYVQWIELKRAELLPEEWHSKFIRFVLTYPRAANGAMRLVWEGERPTTENSRWESYAIS